MKMKFLYIGKIRLTQKGRVSFIKDTYSEYWKPDNSEDKL